MILLVSAITLDGNGREFAGFYEISGGASQGEAVTATLRVRLSNHRADGVRDAKATLEDSLPPRSTYGSFAGLLAPRRGSVLLKADFTISRRESGGTEKGAVPGVDVEFRFSQENRESRAVELARRNTGLQE